MSRINSGAKRKKKGLPISVKSYKSEGHHLERRIFNREIWETYCMQPGCKFRGKHAAQGVCHTKDSLSGLNHKMLEAMEKRAFAAFKEEKDICQKYRKGKFLRNWIKYLEGQYVANILNYHFTLDELIRLRAENARLRNKLGLYK